MDDSATGRWCYCRAFLALSFSGGWGGATRACAAATSGCGRGAADLLWSRVAFRAFDPGALSDRPVAARISVAVLLNALMWLLLLAAGRRARRLSSHKHQFALTAVSGPASFRR